MEAKPFSSPLLSHIFLDECSQRSEVLRNFIKNYYDSKTILTSMNNENVAEEDSDSNEDIENIEKY